MAFPGLSRPLGSKAALRAWKALTSAGGHLDGGNAGGAEIYDRRLSLDEGLSRIAPDDDQAQAGVGLVHITVGGWAG